MKGGKMSINNWIKVNLEEIKSQVCMVTCPSCNKNNIFELFAYGESLVFHCKLCKSTWKKVKK